MTSAWRGPIERLWAEHLARPFPPDLRGVDVGGVDVVLLDSDIAGYVSTWLSSAAAHRYEGRPYAAIVTSLVGHTTAHAVQIQLLTTTAVGSPDALG